MLAEGSLVAGRYELATVVAQGGQGVLWRAHDRRSGRPVAVKVFLSNGDDATTRSLREIKILRGLPPSPYVVAIEDSGDQDGAIYLIMEWLDGRPLREVRKPRLERVQHWSRQICLGLAHCHRHGVYHRDVKPANIMITGSEDVKLVDFGIARRLESTLTRTGYPVGSWAYMAPERWLGARGDHLGDLYSFGCVLYELLTGYPPFGHVHDDTDPQALRYKHVNSRPAPPISGFSGVPETINRLTLELLAKRPEDRPQSALEVAARFQEIIRPPVALTLLDGPDDGARPRVQDPYVDPDSVDSLLAADAAVQRTARRHGPRDLLTLEARVTLAEQIGRSGDRAGAIREYDEVIALYDQEVGPYHQRAQEVRTARMRWVLGRPE